MLSIRREHHRADSFVVIGRIHPFRPGAAVLGQTWDSDNYYFHSKDSYFIIDDYNDFVCTALLVNF